MRFDRGTDPRATALRLIAECRDAQNTTLDLSSVGLTLLEADVVAGLTSLTSLTSVNLQDNEIGPDGAQALAGLTGLTSLILGINTIGAEGAQALKGLTRLTDLELGNCKIGDRGVQALAGLTSLTTLGLGDNDISDEGAWALSGLTNLTELFLWKNAIGADGAQALKGLTGLTKLDMLENRIGSDGAQALKGLTALTCLNLSDNNLGDEGVQALKGLTALTWLDLSDNNISDDGVQALKGLTNLARLELSGNTIRGNGPRALTGLTALTDLDLSRNQIGDEGAQASTALTSLTHLDLSRNPIGDQGALALLHLPSLTGLDLKDNKLGDDVASEVERVISLRRPAEPVDPTTPEELLALAKHLAADPKLDAIFRRVGLHKPFIRPDEYFRVIDSREAFAPHLHDRPCSSSNLPLAEALARRLHAGHISSDAGARAFLADRIRHYPSENKDCSVLLESEVKDIMRNLLESSFFQKFEDYRRRKAEVIETGIDPYEHMVGFVGDQMWIYGLGGRGWSQIELVVISCLNRLWFDAVPDLSPATVERMLQSPREFLSLYGDKVPRKG
jgi:Leucine-rich repeat (LRR) protein